MAQGSRPAADAGVAIGQVFLGKYRVESILGSGGMGVVAKCVHLQLEKYVAIKMLRQDVLLDQDAKERFLREAQSASKLRSEHVAKVEDVGHFEDGVPYMVMEFLDGHDLGDLVDERGAIAAPFATMLMLQACEALAEAHARGIVHRDVKPSNLFVTWRPDGSAIVKVLDFGISKSASGTDMRLTQTQSLLGTPAYMSPEQMRSARLVDARTDIWSFGTVFYELLEGRRPFEAESFSEMCVKVAVDPPAPMINAPAPLQAIILRCLAKSPDQRYANMAELGKDLLPHVQDVHQASLLVERMVRVLGRASAGGDRWESPSTGVTRTPVVVNDIASAPIVVPWQTGTDAFGAAVPTPSPFAKADRTPAVPVATLRDAPSRPASQAPTRRSRKPFVFLGAFLAIGIAMGLAFGLGGDEPEEVVEQPMNNVTAPDQPVDKPATTGEPVKQEPVQDPIKDTINAKTANGSDNDKIEIEPTGKPDIRKQPVKQPTNSLKQITKVPPKHPPKKPDKKRDPNALALPKSAKQPNDGKKPAADVKQPEAFKCPIADRLPSGGCAIKQQPPR